MPTRTPDSSIAMWQGGASSFLEPLPNWVKTMLTLITPAMAMGVVGPPQPRCMGVGLCPLQGEGPKLVMVGGPLGPSTQPPKPHTLPHPDRLRLLLPLLSTTCPLRWYNESCLLRPPFATHEIGHHVGHTPRPKEVAIWGPKPEGQSSMSHPPPTSRAMGPKLALWQTPRIGLALGGQSKPMGLGRAAGKESLECNRAPGETFFCTRIC